MTKNQLSEIIKNQYILINKTKKELITNNSYDEAVIFRELEVNLLKSLKKLNNETNNSENSISFSPKIQKIKADLQKGNIITTTSFVLDFLTSKNNTILNQVLKGLNIEKEKLINDIKNIISTNNAYENLSNVFFIKALNTSKLEAKLLNQEEVNSFTLFISIIRNDIDFITKSLNSNGVDYSTIRKEFLKINN